MPFPNPVPQIFPENLLTGVLPGGEERRWWVVHTKARQEKAIARNLLAQSIPYFAPQTEKTTLVRGRKRRSFVPVFSGYVFLYGSESERYRSLTTNRVAQVIKVDDQQQLRQDLACVWRMIESKVPLTVEGRLAAGKLVRVRSGVLAGIEGVVMERRAKCRLLVAVHMLQQGVSVAIDDFMLEPI
ncbi:MAG TPA: transcription termination/antitermination NusG family protein [Pirellulales bacterium]|nr:transcription termination/antitermination NusG family protein [Pirellulales bacterium]